MVISVVTASLRGPSPSLALHQQAAALQADAAETRLRAIDLGRPQVLEPQNVSCDRSAIKMVFFADGSGASPPLCLSNQGHSLTLVLDPVSGQLAPSRGPS